MHKTTFKRFSLLTSILIIISTATALLTAATDASYNLSESKLFSKTLKYIDDNYVEPERINPKEMFKAAINDLQKSIPEILVTFDSPTAFTITIGQSTKKFTSPLGDLDQLDELMHGIMVFIELNYKGDIKFEDIESLLVNGALSTLDPHSAFLTPDVFKEFKIDTGGEFGGLGIVITSKDGQLTVIAPIEDTPAASAGIKSGDVITQIDNESTINMSLTKAVERLRGKIGTKVTLVVERKGKTVPFKVIMTRAQINIDSIKSTLIQDTAGKIAYIKIKRFQKDTYNDFIKALKKLQTDAGEGFKGLIIDMRNNPGGLLDEAVDIADAFIASGTIVSTVGAHQKFIDSDEAHEKGTEPGTYPIVTLVNEGSASASEIVAGALQAHKRSLILGQRTFGKGSVQSVYELAPMYALKLTIAQYLTAGKNSIQTVGVTPDILIEPAVVDKEAIDVYPNKHSSEMELEKHLAQLKPLTSSTTPVISYLTPLEDETMVEEKRQKEYSDSFDFENDFAVKLSTRILLATKSSDPAKMMEESKEVSGKLVSQENEKISAKLSELGIPWVTASSAKSPKVEISSELEIDGKPIERGSAGDTVNLVLKVSNKGTEPLSKLIGIIETENKLIDEKEFIFGTVKPGETAIRKIKIELSPSLYDINIPFAVKLMQDNVALPTKYNGFLKVSSIKHPSFSINYLLEKPATVEARHPLPRGKSVPLSVKVKNTGSGPTKEAYAYISNTNDEPGLFIETGRVDLGVIKQGETKKITFSIKIQPDITVSTFKMELGVGDRKLLDFVSTELEITVESGQISPEAGIWYEGPKIELDEKLFPIKSKSEIYHLSGKIADKIAVKDYYVYVDDEKAVYKSNPAESQSMPISADLKLKQGNNTVTVVARNLNKISTMQNFVIER